MAAEAVFTKTEMNNEKTLIFFKILSMLKDYQDWSSIYWNRNEEGTNH